jgi:hypothetical protein
MELRPLPQSIRNESSQLEKARTWNRRIIIGIDFSLQYTSTAFALMDSSVEVKEEQEQAFKKGPNYKSWDLKAKASHFSFTS